MLNWKPLPFGSECSYKNNVSLEVTLLLDQIYINKNCKSNSIYFGNPASFTEKDS